MGLLASMIRSLICQVRGHRTLTVPVVEGADYRNQIDVFTFCTRCGKM